MPKTMSKRGVTNGSPEAGLSKLAANSVSIFALWAARCLPSMVPRQMMRLTFTSRCLPSGVLRPENHSKRRIGRHCRGCPGAWWPQRSRLENWKYSARRCSPAQRPTVLVPGWSLGRSSATLTLGLLPNCPSSARNRRFPCAALSSEGSCDMDPTEIAP